MKQLKFALLVIFVSFLSLNAGICLCYAVTVTFDDFSDISDFTINGTTASINSSGPVIFNGQHVFRLTNNLRQGGSTFLTEPIALEDGSGFQASFSTYFSFQITDPQGISDSDGRGADGIVFVIQTNANNVGGRGGGIGYQGIKNSIGIEFDTWNNGSSDGYNGNHVGINLNGSMYSVARYNVGNRMNNGNVWYAWIDYDGDNDLIEVRLSQNNTRPETALLSVTVDLVQILGTSQAYVGFTSGTGSAAGDHDIRSWEFISTCDPFFSAKVFPKSHDFGTNPIGCTAQQAFTVENVSDSNVTIDTLFITGIDAFEFYVKNDNCSGQTLQPSETRTLNVVFEPISEGPKDAMLNIPLITPISEETLIVELNGLATPNQPPSAPVLSWPSSNDTGIDPHNISFQWEESTDAENDSIEYCITVNEDGEPDNIPMFTGCDDEIFTSDTSFTLPIFLEPNKTYWWTVRAKDEHDNWSEDSASQSFTTGDWTDLIAKSLTPTYDLLWPVSAQVVVENAGSAPRDSVVVHLIAGVCGEEHLVGSWQGDLPLGETTIGFDFDLTSIYSDQAVVLYAKIDPDNLISERYETNNEVGNILRAGNVTPDQLAIVSSRSFQTEFCPNAMVTFSGTSVYKLISEGVACFDYSVKGGDVTYTLVRSSDQSIVASGNVKTTVTGYWALSIDLPGDVGGVYELQIKVTDHTLIEEFSSLLSIVDCSDSVTSDNPNPVTPSPPYIPSYTPSPGYSYGDPGDPNYPSGTYSPIIITGAGGVIPGGGGGGGSGGWDLIIPSNTQIPVYSGGPGSSDYDPSNPVGPIGPGPDSSADTFDAWVYSVDIEFSNDTPDEGETITIKGIVHANNSYFGLPVRWKATYLTAGTVTIAPTTYYYINGDLPVEISFTRYVPGDIIIEIELGPDFSDADNSNNAATRVLDGESQIITDLVAREKYGKVQLVWTHIGAESYNVYRRTEGEEYALIVNTTSTYSTYLDRNVISGTTYYYVVKSISSGSESLSSNEVCITPRTTRR